MSKPTRDRFDDVPRSTGRVGAHRAEAPGMNGWVVLLWSFVAAVVLIIVGIFGALVVMGRITLGPDASTSAPAPTQTGVVDTTISVMILNATPEAGLEDEMREFLITSGWAAGDVFASASASQDFATTTVYYVNDDDQLAAAGLADLIGGAAVEQSDTYADLIEEGKEQLTVVIGLDRTAAGASTSTETPTP